MTKRFQYGVTYYFMDGKWHSCHGGNARSCMAMGYPAVEGSEKIGPPDGYPSEALRKKTNEICGADIWPMGPAPATAKGDR